MIERVKGYPLLAGMRGEKAVDLELLEESLLRLSRLVTDFEEDLEELDLNPFVQQARQDAWDWMRDYWENLLVRNHIRFSLGTL